MKSNSTKIVICGTDTDIGKTIVSAFFVKGLNAIYWKPIQSGIIDGTDTERVCEILDLSQERTLKEAYKFRAPVSPHWAAEQEETTINPNHLKIPNVNRTLIIETAGGLMVPINRNLLQIDLLKEWNIPVILVAKTGLGTLNHTLLSLEALQTRGIPILGIFLNGPKHADNPRTLKEFGLVPLIGSLPQLDEISERTLKKEWEEQQIENNIQGLINNLNSKDH